MRYRIEAIHSRDDGGWYREVVNVVTGETIHTTDVCLSLDAATIVAQTWIHLNAKPESGS